MVGPHGGTRVYGTSSCAGNEVQHLVAMVATILITARSSWEAKHWVTPSGVLVLVYRLLVRIVSR